MHLTLAEYAKQCGAVTNFKSDLILNFDIFAWWTESS
jgi:hypothetical protein